MKLKYALLTAAGLTLANAAHAGLSFVQIASNPVVARTEMFNDIAGINNMAVGTSVTLGKLVSDRAGTVTFTYLGNESGFVDSFSMYLGGPGQTLLESNAVGTSVSALIGPGDLNFWFEGNTGQFAYNGGSWATGTSIGLITGATGSKVGNYQYILGYNDSAGASRLGDWDDFVVGVTFVSAVPEPETYAMMLLGLGAVGAMARRRKATQAKTPSQA